MGVRRRQDLEARIAELAQPTEPEGWFEKLKAAPTRTALRKLAPKSVKSGPCQQIVRLGGNVDLGQLPALRSQAAGAHAANHGRQVFFRPTPLRAGPCWAATTWPSSTARGWPSAGWPTTSRPRRYRSTVSAG